jgi:hypothetical protein
MKIGAMFVVLVFLALSAAAPEPIASTMDAGTRPGPISAALSASLTERGARPH